MFKTFKTILYILKHFKQVEAELKELKAFVRSVTDVHVDVGVRGRGNVILIGRYRGKGYIQCYEVPEMSMHALIGEMTRLKKLGDIKTVDAPPYFHSTFDF